MINAVFLNPLGPSLILALGGLLLLLMGRRWPGAGNPRAHWALPLAFLFLLLAGIVLVLLRRGQPGLSSTAGWAWQPLTVAGSTLAWRLDGWNWLAAALLVGVSAAALALQLDSDSDPAGPTRAIRTLWLAAAGLAFVFSDNVVTLATCWVALDGMLLLRLFPDRSAQPAARTWGLLSLGALVVVAALVFLGEPNARVTFSAGPFPGVALALLWLAALIRTGAYPFHLWLTGSGKLEASDRVALYLLGPTTGIWLLARVDLLAGPAWAHRIEWVGLGALALLGTALAAWASTGRQDAWRWVAINRASLVVLTACLAGIAGPAALVWPMVTFALGAGLLALGMALRDRWSWSLPVWLGALVVWGLPGTPGFMARSVLVLPAPTGPVAVQLSLGILLFGIILVSEVLLVAALWEIVTGSAEQEAPATASGTQRIPRPSIWQLGATTVLLAVPVLVWGLWPRQPALLAGLGPGSGLPLTLLQALGEARRSVWTGLIAAGIGGALLGRLRPQIFTGMRGWQEGITSVVGLEWLYQAALLGVGLAGSGLQYFARLGEGEGYLGWLALALLLLWILLRT